MEPVFTYDIDDLYDDGVLVREPEPPRPRGWTSEQIETLRLSQIAWAWRATLGMRSRRAGSWDDWITED